MANEMKFFVVKNPSDRSIELVKAESAIGAAYESDNFIECEVAEVKDEWTHFMFEWKETK